MKRKRNKKTPTISNRTFKFARMFLQCDMNNSCGFRQMFHKYYHIVYKKKKTTCAHTMKMLLTHSEKKAPNF